jgi:hypothetical protein
MKKRASDILKWLTNIGNLAKTITSLVALGSVIIAGIKVYNKAIISRDKKIITQEVIVRDLKTLINKVDSLQIGQFKVEELVNEHGQKLDQLDRKQDIMKGIMTREFAKTMTPSQVLDMMEQFELKKNEGSSSMIPSGPIPYWTPYNSEFMSKKQNQ